MFSIRNIRSNHQPGGQITSVVWRKPGPDFDGARRSPDVDAAPAVLLVDASDFKRPVVHVDHDVDVGEPAWADPQSVTAYVPSLVTFRSSTRSCPEGPDSASNASTPLLTIFVW